MKRQKKTTNGNPSLIRPHIYLGPELMIGPGKIALLKGVRETGSISAAARQMGMNYKRAWYLLDTLNQGFHQPVVEAVQGGREGGGTRLTQVKRYGLQLEVEAITYFLGRETLLATNKPGMAIWRERLFALMSRNAQSAMTFFRIPPDQVVEMGFQVEL